MASMPNGQTNYNDLVLNDRINGRLYYDRAIFHDEIEKIWHREWVYVAHESEVAEPGDYVTRTIGLQPVIVSRGADGQIHLLLNRCMHRGNTVCQSERGNAHAHLRATLLGRSIAIGVNDGDLTLGRFQSIIFAELDGPRKREITVQVMGE